MPMEYTCTTSETYSVCLSSIGQIDLHKSKFYSVFLQMLTMGTDRPAESKNKSTKRIATEKSIVTSFSRMKFFFLLCHYTSCPAQASKLS